MLDALKKEMEFLKGQIIETQKVLLGLEKKYDGIRNVLSSYEPDAVPEPKEIVASMRTVFFPGVKMNVTGAYANSSMREAIIDILNSQSEKYFTSREIYDALMEGGKIIGDDSTNKMQNVSIALYKFENKNKIIKSKKVGNRKGYQLVRRDI